MKRKKSNKILERHAPIIFLVVLVLGMTLSITTCAGADPITGPVANFSADPTEGFAPLSVRFTDLSENAESVAWDFDSDGIADSAERNPVYEFTTSGMYTVNLTATNGTYTNSTFATINVTEEPASILPVANFSADPTEGFAPLSVQFTDLSENAESVAWDFGDGGYSTELNPVYEFTTPGTYTVNLTATNGTYTNSMFATIDVVGPVANFSMNVTEGYAPFSVQFTDFSEHTESVAWDFGDGGNSTELNPVHEFTTPGRYTVNLTATNGTYTNSMFATINVIGPVANFSADPTEGYAPLSVQFTDFSEHAESVAWDFDDDGIVDSTELNPVHEFTTPGTYTVNLIAINGTYTNSIFARIAVFGQYAENYSFVKAWGSDGTGDEQFQQPLGVAVDSSGNVYVADYSNYCITKFDSNGNIITKWGSTGSDDGQFHYPYGVAVDSLGNVYVADSDQFDGGNDRIQKFDSNGNFITKWGSTGSDDGQFQHPLGVAVDSLGNVYVADSDNHRIQKFDSNGNFITKWGSTGSGDGQFYGMYSLAVDSSDNVYVADWYNACIQKFDSNGNFITKWGSTGGGDGQFEYPYGISIDSSGNVYVSDYFNNRVQKFDSNGNFITKWGSTGRGAGQFYGPTGIAVDSLGNVYVADQSNGRIQKFAISENSTSPVLPVANFTSNVTSGYAPLSVQFTDLSENAESVAWDFDSDGIADSTELNPVHEFTTPGMYTVSLTATNGTYTNSMFATIDIIGPVANFSANTTGGFFPLSVQFTDLSENAESVAWDFGDGGNSTERNPVHEFTTPGMYTVNLTATNGTYTNSMFATINVASHSGGPDNYNYVFKDSDTVGGPTYDWIEISETGNQALNLNDSDDFIQDNVDLGFFFNYYGTDYSRLAIANNGLLFSSGTTSQWMNEPIGQSPYVHGFVSPFWDDLVTWNGGKIYYQTLGTAPNRIFVTEWVDNQHYPSSDSGITFESILYEGSNNIKFQYKDVVFGNVSDAEISPLYDNGGSATVGIESPDGTDGLQYSYDTPVIDSGKAILFVFPQFEGTNLYLSQQAPVSKDHGSSMTYTLSYHDFGDESAQNVILEDRLPDNVMFEAASDGGIYDPSTRTVTWDIGSINSTGHSYRTLNVSIPKDVPVGTVITNNANISTSNLEVRYDDNEAHAQTEVTGSTLPPNVTVEPNNGGIGTPSVYWYNPTNFSYHSEQPVEAVEIRIHIDDGESDIIDNMTAATNNTTGNASDWIYTTTFYPRHGSTKVTYTFNQNSTVSFNIYIDPAGYIYDVDTGSRISGASVWLQRPNGLGGWENVPTGESIPVAQPDTNPLTSDQDGMYQWDVLEGSYKVHVEAPGYEPADSIVVSIPPPVNDLHVGLHHIDEPDVPLVFPVANFSTDVSSGYAPLSVQFTDLSKNATGWNWDFGDEAISTDRYPIHTYSEPGNYTVNLTASNGNGINSTTGTINVQVDIEKPVLESVVLFPANTTAGSKIDISASITDNLAVAEVAAGDVQLMNVDDSWQGNITAPSSPGKYSLSIKANDAAGNTINTSVPYNVVRRQGKVNIAVLPTASKVAAGKSTTLAIKVKNTQNVDDTFKVRINVNGLPAFYRAATSWFSWTEKTVNLRAKQEVLIPIEVKVPAGTVNGIKFFKVSANSEKYSVQGSGTGSLVISRTSKDTNKQTGPKEPRFSR